MFNFLLFQTIDFPQKFFETPTLVTTTKHLKDDVNSHIDADNNAITEWIEVKIYKRLLPYFRHHLTSQCGIPFCFEKKDIQNYIYNPDQNFDDLPRSMN